MTTVCIIIDEMAVCLKPTQACKHFKTLEPISGCRYNMYGRCCHSTAIADAENAGETYILVKK